MSQMGQTRKSGDAITTSALPLTADIRESGCDVRKVPKPDSRSPISSAAKVSRALMSRQSVSPRASDIVLWPQTGPPLSGPTQ
jgi:hypothetical protein